MAEVNKIKYLNYVARVTSRLYNEDRQVHKLRVIVIYTADVPAGSTNPVLDLGEQRLSITEVFLTDLDAETILNDAGAKITGNEKLTGKDMIKLMICPLSVKGHDAKQAVIGRAIRLIADIDDDYQRNTLLKGLLVFCDKVISREDSRLIRRLLTMTKVEMIFYKEKMEAVRKAVEETKNEEERKASENLRDIARRFLQSGDSTEKVAECIGMPLSNVEELAAQLNA